MLHWLNKRYAGHRKRSTEVQGELGMKVRGRNNMRRLTTLPMRTEIVNGGHESALLPDHIMPVALY